MKAAGVASPMSSPVNKAPNQSGHRRRLRQRFEASGLAGFAPHEVVELLLTLAIPRRDVKPMAYELLGRYGSLKGIMDASADDIREISGVGESGAFAFKFLKSLIVRFLQQDFERLSLTNAPQTLEMLWRYKIGSEPTECFEVAFFDAGLRLCKDGILTHSAGTSDRAAVFAQEICKAALKRNAHAMAFAHNHPSGDPSPSDADKLLTKQLTLAAAAAQIKVIDHLIVTTDRVFSFSKEGLL
jgi:DNA repair protein RadC